MGSTGFYRVLLGFTLLKWSPQSVGELCLLLIASRRPSRDCLTEFRFEMAAGSFVVFNFFFVRPISSFLFVVLAVLFDETSRLLSAASASSDDGRRLLLVRDGG